MQRILALDLGTRTGWALRSGGRTESGVQVFDVKRGESSGMRYVRFNRWLYEVVYPGGLGDEVNVQRTILVYEQTHQRGGAATEVAAGFATRVQEFGALHHLEHAAVHTGTLKKWATGSGAAGKAAMIEAALNFSEDFCARYKVWHDGVGGRPSHAEVEKVWADEADALCLLEYAVKELV